MEEKDKNNISTNPKIEDFEDKNKALQGFGLSFLMLYFAIIYGVKKYPKGSKARKSFIISCLVTSTILIILILAIVLSFVLINVFTELTVGTTDAIIGGIVG